MRGSKTLAVAVRNPQGEIVIHTEPLNARIYGGTLAKIPFLRGLTLLWDALGLGIKSLMFSADVALEEEAVPGEDGGDGSDETANSEPERVFEGPLQWGTVLFSLSFAIVLFFLIPAFIGDLVARWLDAGSQVVVSNAVEGIVRLVILVGYIWAIGQMEDIKRLFGYHGAEHKTINAYEAGAELTPVSVDRFSLEHPRCGTAFLLTVVIISILVYTLLPPLTLPQRLLSRVILLPLIAGIAYEFIRFTARHQDKGLVRLITKPNLALQRLTTRPPDQEMLAVAIAAFQHMRALEQAPVADGDEIATAKPEATVPV